MVEFAKAAPQRPIHGGPDWLEELREQGRTAWQAQPFPTRKTENWKYTPLRALERGEYLAEADVDESRIDDSLRRHFEIPELGGATLVFVNGQYSESLSSDKMPDGMKVVRFAEASAKESQEIRQYLGSIANTDNHLFAALNDSWLADGVFVRVDENVRVDQPLHCVWLTVPQSEGFSLTQRLLVVMGAGSEATVVEHFTSDREAQNAFTNGVTELIVKPNARLHHCRLQMEEAHAIHIGGVHVRLDRDAVLDSFHLGLGSELKRIDVVVNHTGEGAHCDLNGVYLPRGKQHIDYHTCIEHAVPHCTSDEVFRGIVADKAKAVFNGRIHIHPDAQKTRAELSNKNLLTSNQAEVDTKPELEIYADDVQCAHGATVAQLDEMSLYYLLSRGIGRGEAEVMLSFGFINELVDKLGEPAISDYLRPRLARLFAVHDDELARHIG